MRKPDAWVVAGVAYSFEDTAQMAAHGTSYQIEPLYRRTDADRAVLLAAAEFLARTDTLKEGVDGRDERRALAAKLREMAS